MMLNMLASQLLCRDIEDGKRIDKWTLYRALSEASAADGRDPPVRWR